jgi:hypothetical protein
MSYDEYNRAVLLTSSLRLMLFVCIGAAAMHSSLRKRALSLSRYAIPLLHITVSTLASALFRSQQLLCGVLVTHIYWRSIF